MTDATTAIRTLLSAGQVLDAAVLFQSLATPADDTELREAVVAACLTTIEAAERDGFIDDADTAASLVAEMLPAERLPEFSRHHALAIRNGATPKRMLRPAADAFVNDPLNYWSTVLLMEAAEFAGAHALAKAVATVLKPVSATPALAARAAELADRSAIGLVARPATNRFATTMLGMNSRADFPEGGISGRQFAALIETIAETPCDPEALARVSVSLTVQILRGDIGLTLVRQLTDVAPDNPLTHMAMDLVAERTSDLVGALGRRAIAMTRAVQDLVPPGEAHALVPWDHPASAAADVLLGSVRAQGFVLVRDAIPVPAVAAAAAEMFADGLAGYGARPASITPATLANLIAGPLPRLLGLLGFTTLDGSTTHSRAIVPGSALGQAALSVELHQDSQLFGQPLINLWVPFDACGEDAPSLELVPDFAREILRSNAGETDTVSLSSSAISRGVAAELVAAVGSVTVSMRPGDALLFLGTVPHRTHFVTTMQQPRRSAELRFVPPAYAIQPCLSVPAVAPTL